MNRFILAAAITSMALPSVVFSETNVNVSIGVPGIAVQAPPRVVFQSPPLFLSPSNLGFYIGVDMPYDLVFISGSYYLFQGNGWYRSRHYNGPWTSIRHEHLPQKIKRYNLEKIRHHRDLEYRSFQHDHERYRGRKYRPGRVERDYHHEERKYKDKEHRHEKGERHSDRDHGDHGHDRGRHRGHND
jgi:hypothetical protein